MKKTTLASIPALQAHEEIGGKMIDKVDTLTSLGTEVPLHGHAKLDLPKKRHQNAMGALTRIAALRLPTHVVQQLVEIVIIPKTCFHVQARPLQDYWCERLRRAIHVSVGLRHKGHCYEVIAALFRRAHRYDPKSASVYCHLVSVLRILRSVEEAAIKWRRVHALHQPPRPRGPVGVWKKYLSFLNIEETKYGEFRNNMNGTICAWNTSEWGKVAHFLRDAIRLRLLARAALKRRHLQGAVEVDYDVVTKILRDRSVPNHGEIRLLMADGVWTQCRRQAAGWVMERRCPFCGEGEEDLNHLLYLCKEWSRYRHWTPQFEVQVLERDPACKWCGLVDQNAPPNLKKNWRSFVLDCACILAARARHGAYPPHVPPGEKDKDRSSEKESHAERSPGSLVGIGSRPLEFSMTFQLGGKQRWRYTREQWNRLGQFASLLRWPSESDKETCPFPAQLEFVLSYICVNGGFRFHSAIGHQQRGHWITTQIEQMTVAWGAFSVLTGAPLLVGNRGDRLPKADWGPSVGLPKLPCLAQRVFSKGKLGSQSQKESIFHKQ